MEDDIDEKAKKALADLEQTVKTAKSALNIVKNTLSNIGDQESIKKIFKLVKEGKLEEAEEIAKTIDYGK